MIKNNQLFAPWSSLTDPRSINFNIPVAEQMGGVLLQFPSASHIRVSSPRRVYPVSQLYVASDRYVVLECVTCPSVGSESGLQSETNYC